MDDDEITLELARLVREAHAKARKRISEQQLGEAWKDLAEFNASPADLSRACFS